MLKIQMWIHDKLVRPFKDNEGATAVEYGIMVGLIAVVIIVAVTTLGLQLQNLFNYVSDQLPPA